jgi:hypothetical protein
MNVIDVIEQEACAIRSGKHTIQPGQPQTLSSAASVGDGIWQGDLGIEVVGSVPADYVLDETGNTKLVPGDTVGSNHRLDSMDGVELYRPKDWYDSSYEGLAGPVFKLSNDRVITHPRHGDVTVLAGFIIACRYQREYDLEQARERRARD